MSLLKFIANGSKQIRKLFCEELCEDQIIIGISLKPDRNKKFNNVS